MIKQADKSDGLALAKLAIDIWDDNTLDELKIEFENLTENQHAVCFIKYSDGKEVGFAQCQLRSEYVEGTETSPVGYLEGIFVLKEYRNKGYAKELLSKCEKWAKDKNCTEFASDCEIENDDSLKFHLAMDFEEANRIICFRKEL